MRCALIGVFLRMIEVKRISDGEEGCQEKSCQNINHVIISLCIFKFEELLLPKLDFLISHSNHPLLLSDQIPHFFLFLGGESRFLLLTDI